VTHWGDIAGCGWGLGHRWGDAHGEHAAASTAARVLTAPTPPVVDEVVHDLAELADRPALAHEVACGA